MSQVAAGSQRHAHDGIARLQQGLINAAIGLGAGMGLHVDKVATEQLLGPFDGQFFRNVNILTAAVITPVGIALGVFIGHHRTLGFKHGPGNDVFRSDQFDFGLFPLQFTLDRSEDIRVTVSQRLAEKTGVEISGIIGFGDGHSGFLPQNVLYAGCDSLSTRRAWRPPSNSVSRKIFRQSRAVSLPITRPPKTMTLASLCRRHMRAPRAS